MLKEAVDEVERKQEARRAARRKAAAAGVEDQPFAKVLKFWSVFRNEFISQGLYLKAVCMCVCVYTCLCEQ